MFIIVGLLGLFLPLLQGILFIVIGILIATGLMQDIEAWILTYSPIAPWEIGSDIGR